MGQSYLRPGTAAWDATWAALARLALNRGLDEPAVAECRGEVWEYMGPGERGHCFRHRFHPATGRRESVVVPRVGRRCHIEFLED